VISAKRGLKATAFVLKLRKRLFSKVVIVKVKVRVSNTMAMMPQRQGSVDKISRGPRLVEKFRKRQKDSMMSMKKNFMNLRTKKKIKTSVNRRFMRMRKIFNLHQPYQIL